jgi:predicted RNA-binding Zn-ribbon protein involved in translation (DUF1610 family)
VTEKTIPASSLSPNARCPECGSIDLEGDTPRQGEHECRNCGNGDITTEDAEAAGRLYNSPNSPWRQRTP